MRINLAFTIIITLTFQISNSQELVREMISSQGNSVLLESGHYVSQTIGQQSITGNYDGQNKVCVGVWC